MERTPHCTIHKSLRGETGMIGILFHGPEIFDSGWARRIIAGVSRISDVRCVLAGTIGRLRLSTADYGASNFPELSPAGSSGT